jgi:hypothetical protein
MRIIEDLSAEARILEDREEHVVKEINRYKNMIRAAMLAPLRIKELEKELEGIRGQQKAVEFQIMEVQLQQMSKNGLVVGIKGMNGGKKHDH